MIMLFFPTPVFKLLWGNAVETSYASLASSFLLVLLHGSSLEGLIGLVRKRERKVFQLLVPTSLPTYIPTYRPEKRG